MRSSSSSRRVFSLSISLINDLTCASAFSLRETSSLHRASPKRRNSSSKEWSLSRAVASSLFSPSTSDLALCSASSLRFSVSSSEAMRDLAHCKSVSTCLCSAALQTCSSMPRFTSASNLPIRRCNSSVRCLSAASAESPCSASKSSNRARSSNSFRRESARRKVSSKTVTFSLSPCSSWEVRNSWCLRLCSKPRLSFSRAANRSFNSSTVAFSLLDSNATSLWSSSFRSKRFPRSSTVDRKWSHLRCNASSSCSLSCNCRLLASRSLSASDMR
mmetsp:Transcript_52896/g.141350  ORF Transcript_52896/g.141350 Transcript_52896/m.141350 type:complete len:274 (-) Transcript_52896:371-1192(-)